MSTAEDDDMARSAHLAAACQLAYEVQAQLEQELAMERHLAQATNSAASSSNILGGGTPSATTGINNNPFASFQSMISQATSARSQNHSLLDDGASAMESNGSLLYVPCQINGRMVEMMVDSGSQTSVVSSSMMMKLNLQQRINTRWNTKEWQRVLEPHEFWEELTSVPS